MILTWCILLASLTALIVSADKLVFTTEKIAIRYNVSKLVISLFIIGLGTSLPELTVSVYSALDQAPSLAFGNALGSNIVNISFVFSVALLLYPFFIQVNKREVGFFGASVLLFLFFIRDLILERYEAGLLISLFFIGSLILLKTSEKHSDETINERNNSNENFIKLLFETILYLGILVFSSKLLVEATLNIANVLGVSKDIMGVTVLALGTSLPELASSLAAAKKNLGEIVIGNVLGSNIFNILLATSTTALIAPSKLSDSLLERDGLMVFITSLLFVCLLLFSRKKSYVLAWSVPLLSCYGVYIYKIYQSMVMN